MSAFPVTTSSTQAPLAEPCRAEFSRSVGVAGPSGVETSAGGESASSNSDTAQSVRAPAAVGGSQAAKGVGRAKRLLWVAIPIVVGGPWVYGLVQFLKTRQPVLQEISPTEDHPFGLHNAASWRYGPTVAASSFLNDFDEQQHPIFVVDEVSNPTFLERWSSSPHDRAPWIEVRWQSPIELEKVVLVHGSAFDVDAKVVRRFFIQCIGAGSPKGQTKKLEVVDNSAKTSSHSMHCSGAVGVRIGLTPPDSRASVHLYEVEAWGR